MSPTGRVASRGREGGNDLPSKIGKVPRKREHPLERRKAHLGNFVGLLSPGTDTYFKPAFADSF